MYLHSKHDARYKAVSSRLNGYSMCWFLSTLPACICDVAMVEYFAKEDYLMSGDRYLCWLPHVLSWQMLTLWLRWCNCGNEGREFNGTKSYLRSTTMRSIVGGFELRMNEQSDSFK